MLTILTTVPASKKSFTKAMDIELKIPKTQKYISVLWN